MYSDYSYQSDPEGGEPSTRVKLDKLGLMIKQKFSLHYDFRDDWMFTITFKNITETAGKTVPRVIKEKGKDDLPFLLEEIIIVVTERNNFNRKVDKHEHRSILPSFHR